MEKKRVLITGGAGFVGSHLCDALIRDGQEVICLDDFSTGKHRNVAHLRDHPRFKLVCHDVCFPLSAEADEIYNLACPASPVHYQADPIKTSKTSFLGALNALELAERLRIPVLQASTSECYGDPSIHPQPESYWGNVNPIGIRACYDEGKRCAESLFFDYHRQHGVEIKVARIFNTYGPRMDPNDGRVVSNFIVQALKGDDITIYGDGSQTRSFCYVDDLVAGLMRLMASPREITGPINLGNPGEFTVRELAQAVTGMTESHSRLVYRPLPADDPRQRRPDLSRAHRELGWAPSTALADGLAHTISYLRSLLGLPERILAEQRPVRAGIVGEARSAPAVGLSV